MGQFRVLYDRAFNVAREFEYKGRVVTGACVGLLFRFFKDGKEVFFEEGAEVEVCDNVICSLDKDLKNCCQLCLKPYLVEPWFDEMTFEITEWELMIYAGTTGELFPDFPGDFSDFPVSEGMKVTQEEFAQVLREHWGNFADEIGECLSVGYVKQQA